MTASELSARLALWRAAGLSAPLFLRALAQAGAATAVLAAEDAQLAALGLPAERLARRQDPALAAEVERDLAWLAAPNHRVLWPDRDGYPALLREALRSPPPLFVAGNADALFLPQLAIVGSRHATRAGKDSARAFATDLARAGFAITSGLALGIDAAAHEGALAAPGPTLAILGAGPDRPYPRANAALFARIVAEGGAVVSEFPPGTAPVAGNFPRRNRLISGLALGVLVVEAALQSGSLITAREAARQGRNVWALPGSIHSPVARGCHQLIREGATLVDSIGQLLEDVQPLIGVLRADLFDVAAVAAPQAAAADTEPLLALLSHDVRPLDWLIQVSGQGAEVVAARLLELELDGVVAVVPGGYQRVV